MNQIEVMKQALQVLESLAPNGFGKGSTQNAVMSALRQAIEQAELPTLRPDYESIIDEYIEEYEMLGESEDGRECSYTPNENDKALLKDAFMGFDFSTIFNPPTAPAQPDLSRLEPFVHGLGKAILKETQAALAQQCTNPAQCWEPCGELGNSEEHAVVAPMQQPLTNDQIKVLNFLYGAGELNGVWFGARHPTERGEYWWRKHLRRVFGVDTHGITGEKQ